VAAAVQARIDWVMRTLRSACVQPLDATTAPQHTAWDARIHSTPPLHHNTPPGMHARVYTFG
jgi:hypothetical protein